MSNVKFSQLPNLGNITANTIVPVVAAGTNYTVTAANLQSYVNSSTGNITGANINSPTLNNSANINVVANAQSWTFDSTGNLGLPGGGIIYGNPYTPSGSPGNTITLQPAGSGITTGQKLLVYPTANDGDHIHLASGNLYQTELFLGSDNLYVKLANTGNVVINSNDGTGNTAQWTFGANGNLTLPNNAFAVNYANGTAVSLGGTYGNANVVANLAALGSNPVSTTGNITGGNLDLSYMGGAARGNLTGGNISVTGNITGGNILTAGLLSTTGNIRGGNILTAGAVSASSTITGANLSTGGTVSATGNVQGGNIITGGLISATGNITTAGNILNQGLVSSTGNAIHGNILTGGLVSAAGNITASNVFSSATMSTGGNIFAALNISATGTVYGSNFNTTGLISAGGNVTVGNLLTAGVASATGNVTAANFFGNGNTLSNVATSFQSTWTVPTGNSTQSFTVAASETYYMWVDCNIPNGILAWNATATITNTNVPVVGAQYAWVYNGGGTPIDFTSIPNQFVGTANSIVRSSTAPSATTNRFDFGINNTSGNSQTVRYGWVTIS